MVIGLEVLEYLRIDDPIGAVPVHMFCGIWRHACRSGLFAAGEFGLPTPTGADATSTGHGPVLRRRRHLLWMQFYGVMAVSRAVFAVSHGADVRRQGHRHAAGLREGELEGLDLHEHGVSGYPEFVVNRGMGHRCRSSACRRRRRGTTRACTRT